MDTAVSLERNPLDTTEFDTVSELASWFSAPGDMDDFIFYEEPPTRVGH